MEEYKKEPEIEKTKVPKKGTDTHSPETTGSAHMIIYMAESFQYYS